MVYIVTKKLWAIFLSTLYILYLAFIFPWYLLFLMIINVIRRIRNSMKLKNTLKKQGLPKELRRKLAKNYRKGTKIISIRNIRNIRKRRKLSKKEESSND